MIPRRDATDRSHLKLNFPFPHHGGRSLAHRRRARPEHGVPGRRGVPWTDRPTDRPTVSRIDPSRASPCDARATRASRYVENTVVMFRVVARAAARRVSVTTTAATATTEFNASTASRWIATTATREMDVITASGDGRGKMVFGVVACGLVGGAFAFDKTYGPMSRPDEDWENWFQHRRLYYSRELNKLTSYAASGFSKEYKQDVFFSYERRLRTFSPPEKVFDYFASQRINGTTYMTLSDLVRALLPLHPAVGSDETRAGKLAGEIAGGISSASVVTSEVMRSKLFQLFDTDKNGLYDFSEYLFFSTLVSIDRQRATATFHKYDEDGSGSLDENEFRAMMKDIRTQTRRASGMRTGLDTGSSNVDDIGGGLLDYLFGSKRNKRLKLRDFHDFLQNLRWEMDDLEFRHYDCNKNGWITPRDFGYALVAGSKVDQLPTFLRRVKELPGIESKRQVSRAEFLAFARIAKHGDGKFQKHMKQVSDSGAPITRKRFKKMAKRCAGIKLSDEVINIVFHIFDVDGDDTLSYDEFFNALITWK